MNARLSFLRATMAPAALATAIGLAVATSAPAQAQYTYPGTASSAGHSARISPMRAGARARADYANAPARSRAGNPGMQHGEACPPGSMCATPVPANGRGSERPSGGYGAHESYGAAPVQSAREVKAVRAKPASAAERGSYSQPGRSTGNPSMQRGEACAPGARCATAPTSSGGSGSEQSSGGYGRGYSYGNTPSHSASITPVRAGGEHVTNAVSAASNARHQKLGSGPMRSSKEFTDGQTDSLPNLTTGTPQNPLTGGTGTPGKNKQTHSSGTVISGSIGEGFSGRKHGPSVPNVTSMNSAPSIATPGQTGPTNSPTGSTYATVPGGSGPTGGLGAPSGGGPHQGVGSHGMNLGNGGASGVSEQAGAPDSFGEWVHRKTSDSDSNVTSTTSSDKGTVTWHGDQKWSGTDAQGLTWSHGTPRNGPDGNGGTYKDGHDIPLVKNQDPQPDINYNSPVPGEVVKLHTPQGGTDPGSRPDAPTGGGTDVNNATGFVIAPSGQDASAKPKEKGVLKMNYNGKNGAIDPKLNGTGGGG